MFHVKHSYRFSPDYLSETWLLLAFASGPGHAPRRAGRNRPAGSADPIDRGPRRPIRGARIPALDARTVDSCAGFRSAAEATRPKKAKKFEQNWRISANSRFFTENSLQIRGPDSAVFWQFLAKTAKKGKKTGSLVELVGTGRVQGRRTGRGSRSRCSISTCSATTSEGRWPRSGGCTSKSSSGRPSLVDLVPGCRVLVRRGRRDLPLFHAPVGFERGSRAGARHDSLTKGQKKPARIAPDGLGLRRLLKAYRRRKRPSCSS